ncbi:ArnT family glycosyltransferase [Capilliphycus salinus ALCB114379]|uniref:ArnT family glycosyltransferase n=1 Tax=Capilliphycus salinus TaxID=2768948 RepID=UPI0039A62D84
MKLKSKCLFSSGFKSQFLSQFPPFLIRGLPVIIGLGLIGWLAFFWNLGKTGLVDETEPLFAEAARQMLVTGDWITPYFNEVPRFDKPPLIYWLMAIAYRVVGVNEWGVRLPSAIAAFFLTVFCFYILHFYVKNIKTNPQNYPQNYPQKIEFHPLPWIGAALIAFNPETIAWARIGVSDLLLNACMGSALFAFFRGYAEPKINKSNYSISNYSISPWYFAFYIFLALAVLTKGPIGCVLPLLIIGAFTVYLGNIQKVLREIKPVLGSLVFGVLVLPWYILVTAKHGMTYLNTFFGYHNFQRFTQVVNHHSAPWYFYFIVVLVGFAPWSVYLPFAIYKTNFWRRTYWQNRPRIEHLPLFSLFWFGCVFLFFTISVTKLPSYILPLMPAAALLVSWLWGEILKHNQTSNVDNKITKLPRLFNLAFSLNFAFVTAISLLIFFSYLWIGKDPDMPKFREELHASGFLELSALIWIIAAIFILFFWWKRKPDKILMVNLIGFIAFLIFAVTPANEIFDFHRQQPLRHLAETVKKERIFQEELVMIGFQKPSLVFYTQNPVEYLQYPRDAVNYFRSPNLQKTQPNSLLILATPEEILETGLQTSQYQKLDEAGIYELIRVSKASLLNSQRN